MRDDSPVIRPGTILLTLVLMGVSTLFIGLSAAYLYSIFSSGASAPEPPLLFLINIPILLYATYALRKALVCFDERRPGAMRKQLWYGLLGTFIFMLFQIIGWIWFFRQTEFLSSQLSGFLFVLSATHLAHVMGGLPFLAAFIFRTRRDDLFLMRPMPDWRGYLRGLGRYWRFLDVLWILLVVILWTGVIVTRYI